MRFAFTTILSAPRFGWQPDPPRSDRQRLYRQVRTLGFSGIEWSPRWLDYDRASDEQIRALGEEVREQGLQVSAVNLNRFILSRCPQADEHRRRLMHTVQIAPLLGAEVVIVSLSMPEPPSSDRPRMRGSSVEQQEFAATASVLRSIAQCAGDLGVTLVLELHDDGLLDSSQLCLRMLDAVDHPSVRLNPDLGNLIRGGDAEERWSDALRQLAPHTGYWHVKNYRDGQPAALWDGEIDYAEALAIMRNSGFDGWLSIESYAAEDVMAFQQQSLQWISKVLDQTAIRAAGDCSSGSDSLITSADAGSVAHGNDPREDA